VYIHRGRIFICERNHVRSRRPLEIRPPRASPMGPQPPEASTLGQIRPERARHGPRFALRHLDRHRWPAIPTRRRPSTIFHDEAVGSDLPRPGHRTSPGIHVTRDSLPPLARAQQHGLLCHHESVTVVWTRSCNSSHCKALREAKSSLRTTSAATSGCPISSFQP